MLQWTGRRKGLPVLIMCEMDPSVLSAIIAASAAVIVNIISNVILSSKQTAVIEVRIKQLEDTLADIKKLPDRVTILETKMHAAEDAIKELRL